LSKKITAALIITGFLTISYWLILSSPYFTAFAFFDYPSDYTGERNWSGMYLLEYPAILLWLLVIGVTLLTLGVARVVWQIK
jgi:hypothetical protein